MTQAVAQEPKLAEWFGEFYGHDLHFLHCEVLAIQNIPAKLLKKEPELHATRWFDYRRMHPTKATYLFYAMYVRAYRDFITKTRDRGMGSGILPFKGVKGDFMNAKEKQALWRLRQVADSLGLRYDFFLRFAMNWKIEHNWHHVPRPVHLAANEEMLADCMLAWEQECRNSLQLCKDERYLAQNFFGHADQLAYEAFIVGQIKTRAHPKYSLHAALYTYGVLRIEAALMHFSRDQVEAALLLAE